MWCQQRTPSRLHCPSEAIGGETSPIHDSSVFVSLVALPVIGAGKVNRQALPEPEQCRPSLDSKFAMPRSPVEEVLVQIWADLLSLESASTITFSISEEIR
jgi:hypothetical protein